MPSGDEKAFLSTTQSQQNTYDKYSILFVERIFAVVDVIECRNDINVIVPLQSHFNHWLNLPIFEMGEGSSQPRNMFPSYREAEHTHKNGSIEPNHNPASGSLTSPVEATYGSDQIFNGGYAIVPPLDRGELISITEPFQPLALPRYVEMGEGSSQSCNMFSSYREAEHIHTKSKSIEPDRNLASGSLTGPVEAIYGSDQTVHGGYVVVPPLNRRELMSNKFEPDESAACVLERCRVEVRRMENRSWWTDG
uniref:Uncharacterized protein n=1 Tax=Psilocybe cubensis TaxID=181762 RepID=A0A8H7XZS4_PSICU